MRAQVDTIQKELKESWTTVQQLVEALSAQTQDWEPDTKWRGNAMKDICKNI
jgi:hypothetical protein